LVRLLPFLDHLEKAEVFIKDKGLKMVKDNFEKVLESIGLEQIDATGKEFDPHTAEAIEIVDGDRDNIVKEVIRRGYKRNGKVIRVAQVRVSKKSEIRNPKS
ncbi:nucleotide exchange factor GrpE, partial [Candidatus Roizmanbacteria bacterium RIFCSPHIGHO2_12_FULL_39_8]